MPPKPGIRGLKEEAREILRDIREDSETHRDHLSRGSRCAPRSGDAPCGTTGSLRPRIRPWLFEGYDPPSPPGDK